MKAKIYMDNRMIDNTNPYKIVKDLMRDKDGHIIKHTVYVDIPGSYYIILPARSKSDWSMTVQGVPNLFFMYSKYQNTDEIMAVIFGQDTDKVCYISNSPIYITIDKDHRSIVVSLTRYPHTDYTVIFDEMDIVEEDTTGNFDESVEETVE